MNHLHIPRIRPSVIDDALQCAKTAVGVIVGIVFGWVTLLSLAALIVRMP